MRSQGKRRRWRQTRYEKWAKFLGSLLWKRLLTRAEFVDDSTISSSFSVVAIEKKTGTCLNQLIKY